MVAYPGIKTRMCPALRAQGILRSLEIWPQTPYLQPRGPNSHILLTPCPVTSNNCDLRFFLFASSDKSRFLPRLFFGAGSQGPGSSLPCRADRGGASPVLLDRLSSLTACCSMGLGGRLHASGWGS